MYVNNRLMHHCESTLLIVLQGYSYVAPSVIFSDNTISSDLLKQSKDLQPDNRQLLYASHFKVSTEYIYGDKRLYQGSVPT